MRSPSAPTTLAVCLAAAPLALVRPAAAAPDGAPEAPLAGAAPSLPNPQLNDLDRLTLANWSKSSETPLGWHERGAALTVAPPTPRYAFVLQILPAAEGGYSTRYGGMGGLSMTLGYAASSFGVLGRYRWVQTGSAPGFDGATNYHLAELGVGVQGAVASPKHQLALEAYGAAGGLLRMGSVEDWGGVWGMGGLFTWSFAYYDIKRAKSRDAFMGGSLGVRVGAMYPLIDPTIEDPDLHIGLFFRPFGGFFDTNLGTSTHQSAR